MKLLLEIEDSGFLTAEEVAQDVRTVLRASGYRQLLVACDPVQEDEKVV